VNTAGTLEAARACLAQRRFDLVITDMRLPDGMGTDLLRSMRAQDPQQRCLVITAFGSAENAVESLKAGAFDYLTKPVDLRQFRAAVAAAIQPGAEPVTMPQRATSSDPAAPPAAAQAALDRLVGNAPPMVLVKARIAKVAKSMAPVLVCGESGTGKELVACAIHANSHRAAGPLVAVNCGAIPESLLEAEFFGSKKGAYTGAVQDRAGYFQTAHGGTLFLDEIGDLPLAMQAKLLRAIQERSVRPLGANQEEAVDVRIVSATHKDMATEVAAGRFRQYLYYRLNVIDIQVPALRERTQDLPVLCKALVQRIALESGVAAPELSASALAQLERLPLAGNVRELENLLHRAMALSEGGVLELDTGDAAAVPASPAAPAQAAAPVATADLQAHLDQQERDILVHMLQQTGFNRTEAAQRLGLSLRQIRYRMARLKIHVPGGEPEEPHG